MSKEILFKLKYTCLIIGLGQIGLQYDLKSKFFQTHFKAIFFSKKFILLGAVETKSKLRHFFRSSFGLPCFKKIADVPKNYKPSVVVIAVNTENHFIVFKKITKFFKPKVIIFEKPLGSNLSEAKKIIIFCKKNNIKLFINYIRLYDKSSLKIKKIISKKNIIKKKLFGRVFYNENLLNNGSHLISLLIFFLEM